MDGAVSRHLFVAFVFVGGTVLSRVGKEADELRLSAPRRHSNTFCAALVSGTGMTPELHDHSLQHRDANHDTTAMPGYVCFAVFLCAMSKMSPLALWACGLWLWGQVMASCTDDALTGDLAAWTCSGLEAAGMRAWSNFCLHDNEIHDNSRRAACVAVGRT